MTAHEKLSALSQRLCDVLLSRLNSDLGAVERKKAATWCTVGSGTKFAFIRHKKGGLVVYLRGKEDHDNSLLALAHGTPIRINKRQGMGSDWAKITPYYFDFVDETAVGSAVELLTYVKSRLVPRERRRRIYLSPSEDTAREMVEGQRLTVQVSRIERDPAAREKCIQFFGVACAVCGFSFEDTYGEIGAGFIHVHHLNPLAMSEGTRRVDPKNDLRPVCPNCHEMLHRQTPPFTIEELRVRLSGTDPISGMVTAPRSRH